MIRYLLETLLEIVMSIYFQHFFIEALQMDYVKFAGVMAVSPNAESRP